MSQLVSDRSSVLMAFIGLFLLAVRPVSAHSWVEQLRNIAPNGTMTDAVGYIRGYVSREMPGFYDDMDNFMIPPNGRPTGNEILTNDTLCHPSQTIGNYTADFPMLTVTPGGFIALQYQENGHVTLPDVNPTKPLNRGTVYIYGTTQPSSNELFLSVFQNWTADGTGGDGRGRLLATRNFDDSQCYQINNDEISVSRQAQFKKEAQNPQGADLWCQNDIQLPGDLVVGTNYTLYWIWNWPTFNVAGSPTDIPSAGYNVTLLQHYTSCMDVSVIAGSGSGSSGGSKAIAKNMASSFTHGQDLNNAAVFRQVEAGAFQVNVLGSGGNKSGNSTGSLQTATSAENTATGSILATASSGSAGGEHTVTVTVTETQMPASPTEAESAGDSTTTSFIKTGRRTETLTTYSTTFVTETLTPASVSGSVESGGIVARSSDSASVAAPATTPAAFIPTPGQQVTVEPFLTASAGSGTASTLLRVRRSFVSE
ncbi:hypothetical protein SEPCBS57363_003643 [Sporothrix epigloea]|uniref:DUF7492 domain-containing protein n=1 Tax=Sporothrix epigloea TaxID=1892477 RepID=A0ABP0DMK9_9PEZI